MPLQTTPKSEGSELHPIPHQRGDLGVAELSPPPAWGDGPAVVHVIEAAEGLQDNTLHTQAPKSTVCWV